MKYTLPAMIFSLFKLSMHFENSGGAGGELPQSNEDEIVQLIKVDQLKIFKSVNQLILALQEQHPEMCMKLYLQACQAVNRI